MPDDDDRPRDASSAADRGWADDALSVDWLNAVAPDDIRELAADIKAYRREQRAEQRDLIARRLTVRLGMRPLSLVAIALVIAAVIATVIVVVMPSSSRSLAAAPLAHTSASPASGGLLPAAALQTIDHKTVQAQTLRPSLIALVPNPCDCTTALRLAAREAHAKRLQLIIVAPGARDAEMDGLAGTLGPGETTILHDARGVLASSGLHAVGLTLVVVNADGTVGQVLRAASRATVAKVGPALARVVAVAESAG